MNKFFSSAVAMAVLLCVAFQAVAQSRQCIVKSLIGTVKIRRATSAAWIDAKLGMQLREKDALRTFVESEAELETSEGSIMKIGENSTMEMATLQGAKELQSTKVKIMNGTVLSNIKKLMNTGSRFDFETPTAVASIRGTIIGMDVTGERTQIKVFEGRVVVMPQGSKQGTELVDNQMATVAKGQKTVQVEKLSEKPPAAIIEPKKTPGDSANKAIKDTAKVADSTKKNVDSTAMQGKALPADSVKKDSLKQLWPKDTMKLKPADSTSIKAKMDSLRLSKTRDSIRQAQARKAVDSAAIKAKMDSVRFAKSTVPNVNKDTIKPPPMDLPLRLTVATPAEGGIVGPGVAVTVSGAVVPQGATVSINGRSATVGPGGAFKTTLTAPAKTGDFPLSIVAEYKGAMQNITRTVYVKAIKLELAVSVPSDRQKFLKPLIAVTGTATPGAEVVVTPPGNRILVSASGGFSTQSPIPDEEGEHIIEIEGSLEGSTQKIVRRVVYEPEFQFVLISPGDRQAVSTTMITVKGEVHPSTAAEVVALGRKMTVSPDGTFMGVINFPDEEGDVVLDFEVTAGGKTRSVSRTIVYKKAADTYVPALQGALPKVAKQRQICLPVYDRTANDEITFYWEIDGVRESERGSGNGSFCFELEDGIHLVTVWAEDKAKNQSPRLSERISFVETSTWNIKVRKPSGIENLRLPPPPPDQDFAPSYIVEFSIENLPGDDMRLIREAKVTNQTTGEILTQSTFPDQYLEFEIKLKQRQNNSIVIEVQDVNGNKKVVQGAVNCK